MQALLNYKRRLETKRLILHASHTPPSQQNLMAWLEVTGRGKGLLTCGYHFLLPREGGVVSCRPHDVQGTHCPGYDRESIGICMAGGVADSDYLVQEDNFTEAQGKALVSLVHQMQGIYGPIPLEGHTELPRYQLRAWKCPPTDMDMVRSWITTRS